jgi:anti-anti-sigma factor
MEVRHGPDETRAVVRGELDMATARELQNGLIDAEQNGRSRFVLDLSGLEFIDSTGLRVLLEAASRAGERGARFAVVPSKPVRRLLELTQSSLEVVDS